MPDFLAHHQAACKLLLPRFLSKERLELVLFTNEMRQNKTIQKQVTEICDSSKAASIIRKEIQDKEQELERLRQQSTERLAQKNQQILNLAMLILQIRQPLQNPDLDAIFIDDDQVGHQIRLDLGETARVIQIVYDLDPFMAQNNIQPEVLTLIENQTRDW